MRPLSSHLVRVLFVKQDHASPSGLVGDAFTSLGWDASELVVVPESRYHSPDVPVVFPSAAAFDAVVFYGAVVVGVRHRTIGTVDRRRDRVRAVAISLGVPVLGICFGGQMLAAAVGGSVSRAPAPEIGWISVSTVGEPDLIEAGPWFSWHFDRFTRARRGARARADRARRTRRSASGATLGLQFHPEVTDRSARRLAARRRRSAARRGSASTPQPLLEQTRLLADAAAARAQALVRRFVLRRRAAAGGAAARGNACSPRRAMRPFSHPRGDDAACSQA